MNLWNRWFGWFICLRRHKCFINNLKTDCEIQHWYENPIISIFSFFFCFQEMPVVQSLLSNAHWRRQYRKRITFHLNEQRHPLIFPMFLLSHLCTTGDTVSFKCSTRSRDSLGIRISPNFQICFVSAKKKNAIKATMIMRSLKIPLHRQEVRALNPHWRGKKKASRKILLSDSKRRKWYCEKSTVVSVVGENV